MLADQQTLEVLWKLILTDLVLSGDNAVLIALATHELPPRQQFWGRIGGAFGAVALRVLFATIMTQLLRLPYLQSIGAVVLLWIAIKLVCPSIGEEGTVKKGNTLLHAITIIIIADVTMSFDNVLAIAQIVRGHSHESLLLIAGLLFSLPIVVFGSKLLSVLMDRHRWIIWLGGGVLGHVAVDLAFKDAKLVALFGRDILGNPVPPSISHSMSWVTAVILFALGWWSDHRKKRVV